MEHIINLLREITTKGLEKFGVFYASYRGIVIDNDDPKNLHRVKIQVPEVYGDETYDYWAWPKGLYAGPTWGMQFLPRKGDMVWVEFEMGNPRRPLWTHGYRGNKDFIGEPFKNKEVIGLKTKSGHEILIDDLNGYIRITNSKGQIIDLADKINLGSIDGEDSESGVLGETLIGKLKDLISALTGMTAGLHPGPMDPGTISELNNIKSSLDDIKSKNITLT